MRRLNAPLKRRVHLLQAVKILFLPCQAVRRHVLYLLSRRVSIIDVKVSGGERFSVGFLSLATENSDPVPHVCKKFILVPNV